VIVEAIWDAFHLEAEVKKENSITYVRVQGLDSLSLAQWIKSKYPKLKVQCREHMAFQVSDYDWIKVEYV
jgi:hypothetical protein